MLLGLLVAGGLQAAPEPTPEKTLADLAKARVEAARRTYTEMARNHKEGRITRTEIVYQWSLRWLAAERDVSPARADRVAACKAHWERMKELERMTKDQLRARFVPIEEATAAEFYRLEAELWLAKAKAE
jgi:hypothetical protein